MLAFIAQAALVAAAPAGVQQGVTLFPAEFFAAHQPASAADMLSRTPGFTLDAGTSQRGFEGGGGNALINGRRPVTKTDNLAEVLKRIPAARVERIELIHGGAPGIDMQGRSLMANVVLKDGGGIKGAVTALNNHVADGRDLPTVRAELSGAVGPGQWELAARYEAKLDDGGYSGVRTRLNSAGDLVSLAAVTTRYDGVQQAATAAYEQPLMGGDIRLNARISHEKWKRDEDIVLQQPAPGRDRLDDQDRGQETEIGARFNRPFGERASIELLGLRQTVHLDSRSASSAGATRSLFALDRRTHETIGRAVGRYQAYSALSLEAGAEMAVNRLQSLTSLTVNGAPAALPAANVEVREQRGELFAKALWRPFAAVSLDGGVRFEDTAITARGDVSLDKSLSYLKPHLSATWTPQTGTQLRLRVERRVGQLNFDHLVAKAQFATGAGVASGNPGINPERSWLYETTLEHRFLGKGALTLTARRSEITGVIDRGPVRVDTVDPSTGAAIVSYFDRPANIGPGRKDELIADLTLPLDSAGLESAQLKLTGVRRRSRVVDPATGVWRPISGLRHREWTASFSHGLPAINALYGVDLFSGWDRSFYTYNAVEQGKLRNAFVRAYVEWNPRSDLNLRFELASLGDRGLQTTRTVWPGLRGSGAAAHVDARRFEAGRMAIVRLRKSIG